MSGELPSARRVSFVVTGYLEGDGGGFLDMRTNAGRSQDFSIPDCVVDRSTIVDAPPERLTDSDWEEIVGQMELRLGPGRAQEIARLLRALLADDDGPRAVDRAAGGRIGLRLAGALHAAGTRAIAPLSLTKAQVEEIVRTVLILVQAEDATGDAR